MPAIKKSPSIDTTRLAAQVKRRQAVYVRSRSGRLKVVAYVPLEKKIEKGKWGKENEGHGISALSALDSH
jgi:hypothetical protein